jgi:hypothetical protein
MMAAERVSYWDLATLMEYARLDLKTTQSSE